MSKIDVLDHGFVRLVSCMGSDLDISRAARVSYDAPAREEDEKLIRYLMENNHTSPFESVVMTFEIKAPIFVLRQWHRHRTWSYNEVSARYTELPDEVYMPERGNFGEQSTDNKQMRVDSANHGRDCTAQAMMHAAFETSQASYKGLLAAGIPRELARTVLPVATYSKMFATVDLHNLFHFLRLRLHLHSQYEIRVYAEAILQLIAMQVPIATQAFKETLQGQKND